jgi:predicted CoA-binding protein
MSTPDDACPLPTPPVLGEKDAIDRMLAARRIAIVGLSDDPRRTSNNVGAYLQAAGYQIVPVNPNCQIALGEKCCASLSELKQAPDVVLVFRRSEYAAQVAQEAAAAKAKGLWLQVGIRSKEAQRIAQRAGMHYVEDRCMMVEHSRRGRM